jgi:hypothetical protein
MEWRVKEWLLMSFSLRMEDLQVPVKGRIGVSAFGSWCFSR